jgi:hypothetical protein
MNVKWRTVPDGRELLEHRILTEMVNDSNLRKFWERRDYRDLIYHVILLTGDMNGPSIVIWGDERDSESIRADFEEETHWKFGV